MNGTTLFQQFQKITEAHAVRHGLPVARQFRDDELVEATASVADAERELYGDMSADELVGRLSPDEQRLLDELNARPLIPFRVTASKADSPAEQISILARTSCDAAVQAIQLLFSDSGDCITTGFKVKVEPIRATASAPKEAA